MIGVPLLLELIYLVFFKPLNNKNKNIITIFFFVITSILIAYKLTYLPYIVVIGTCFVATNYKIFLADKKLILFCLVALIFPSIYLIYNYTETLNPIFPFYNKFFKSPLYEIKNFKDERWGPRNIYEIFIYNIICLLHPERNNEWAFISVRLLAEYLIIGISVILLIYNKFVIKNKTIRFILYLSLITILCNYTLLVTTGYYRYGVLIEVLFGMIIILWLYYLFFCKKWIPIILLLVLIIIQSINTYNRLFLLQSNLSWYDYKELRSNSTILRTETKKLFHDYDPEIKSTIDSLQISAFLSSECNGLIRLIAPEKPIYNISSFGSRQLVIDSFERNVIDTLSQKHNFYVMTTKDNLFQKIDEVNKQNYYIDSIVDIYPTFSLINTPFYLLKIKHFNKQRYTITNKKSILRVDSVGYSSYFYFKANNEFKSYVIEDPYTYNWGGRPDSAKFSINGVLYHLNTTGNKNKIITISDTYQLSFVNYNKLHYFIVIQDLQLLPDSLKKQ
jgi:hypothetical protein